MRLPNQIGETPLRCFATSMRSVYRRASVAASKSDARAGSIPSLNFPLAETCSAHPSERENETKILHEAVINRDNRFIGQ